MVNPSTSVDLILELEDLKDHMINVQAYVGRCVARLETLTAVVRAGLEVDRIKRVEEVISFPGPALERYVDTNFKTCLCAERKKGSGTFIEIAGNESNNHQKKSGLSYTQKKYNSTNDQSCIPEILKKMIKVTELDEAVEDSEVISVNDTAVKKNDDSILDSIPPSTRPSLSRKCRKNAIDEEELKNCYDEVMTASSNVTLASKSSQDFNLPTSSSMMISINSMENRVKEICREHGWKVTGSYSTREGKAGCGLVHFYKLEVKGGETDLMTRGVGESKVEAVMRAFKAMEIKADSVQLKKEDDLFENIVNFTDEEPIISHPPLFQSKDYAAHDTLDLNKAKKELENSDKPVEIVDVEELDESDSDERLTIEDNPNKTFPNLSQTDQVLESKMFKCAKCDFTTSSKFRLLIHKESDHNWCPTCYSTFKNQEDLKKHMKTNHSKK